MISMVALSRKLMQSQSTFPEGVMIRNARCPIPNRGMVESANRSGTIFRNALKWSTLNLAAVVHTCPDFGTNCRGSSQIIHRDGGIGLSGYSTPQAVHRNLGII